MTFQLQLQLEHLQYLNVGRKGVHKTRKTSRYYKKTTTTLNLNIHQILINASCLVIDSKNDCIKRFESSMHE